jgi:hypothetical protein
MRVRIIPEVIPEVYDYKSNRGIKKLLESGMRLQYDILSEYTTGPLTEADYFTPVKLNELNLLPGQYRIECYYSIRNGWAMRSANPKIYEVTIVKDDLTVISNDIFEDVLDSKYYGAVYTFEHPDDRSWTVVYDGKLVNSINEPLPAEELDLYIEQNDRYEKIANVTTKKDGTFYYTHKIYGSIEQNMLVKISRAEDDFYNPMNYVEYAGLEFDAVNGRYFVDNNLDLYPDWPFSIYDLLKVHANSYTPPDSLDYWALFNENLGDSTFDSTYHNYEGTLEGNTTWANGRNDSGLEFDGVGNIEVQEIETIGSTIFSSYANISYEYESAGNGFVVSVEHKEITLGSGITTNSAALSNDQVLANCVPFVSIKTDTYGDDWDENLVDVYFESSPSKQVTVQRGEGSGSVIVSIFVVEFDGTNVEVQSGTFSTADSYIDKDIAVITESKAVPLSYWKITGNDDDWDCAMVTTDFLDSDTVRMERDQATGTITGHYYVFEAKNSEFSVQKALMSMASSDDFDTATISSVDTSKSFIISSYEVDEANDDAEEGALDIWLSSATEVRAERRPEANSYSVPTINVFVITFDSGGSSSVQRNSFTWADADTSKQMDITQVDESASMIKGGTMYGIMECDGTASSDVKSVFIKYEFIDNDTVGAERYTNNEDGTGHWEVVEWELVESVPTQDSGIVYPDGDVSAEWAPSVGGSHYALIDEVTLDTSDYIFTSSLTSGNVSDEFNMGYLDVQGGTVSQVQVKVYGNETDVNSSINLFCGSWLGVKQLDMGSSSGWKTFTWTGLSASQTDLDNMKIKFETAQPISEEGATFYSDFDYVQFGDVLDDTLGTSNNEFVITGWLYPTELTSNESENGIHNVFFAKDGNIEIGLNESGFLELYLNTTSIEAVGIYGFSGALPLNQWSYIAIRFNQSDVDVLIQDTWCRTAIGGSAEPWDGGGNLQTGRNLTIGAEILNFTSFTGILDEISVFNATLTDYQVEDHMGVPMVSISSGISKEDGQGGWTLITTPGELISGYLNFEVNASGNEVESLEFYLSNILPDFQTQTEADWDLLASFNYDSSYYSYLLNSRDLPDNNSWYFISKAVDDEENTVYDFYDVYFAIDQFSDLINYTYIDREGRINHNSNIGVVPIEGFEWHITSLNVFVNLSNDIDYLKSVSYSDLYSYYWLIDLVELQNWVSNKGLSPDNYEINFVVQANLSYSFGEPFYLYNYTLDSTTLDIKGPDLELLTGGAYTLSLGATYDVVENNLITMGISSTDTDFNKVTLEYKYDTPTTSDWVKYGDFYPVDSLADVNFDVLNLRDDNNITIRFIGFDDLSNSITLYQGNYWFAKDFNNHENFVVEGLEGGSIYGLDQDGMIDLRLKVLPVDNDITWVWISTGYEFFQLNDVKSEGDHIYFTDDVKLNSSKYPISGTDFTFIEVSVVLYQGNDRIADKKTVITVISRVFDDIVEISDLIVNITESINNVRMSFVNDTNAYNNSHSIPFVVNNIPPVVKVFNSLGALVYTLDLTANYDYLSTLNLTESQLSSSTNAPQSSVNIDRALGGGLTDSGWLSPQVIANIDRYLGSFSNEITSSPQTITSVDRSGSVDWVNPNNVQSQNDIYASANMVVTGGVGGVPVIESWSKNNGGTTASATLTFSEPAGVQSGDLLVIIVMNEDATSTPQFSDNKVGWNFVDTSGNAVSDAHVGVFWRIADETENSIQSVSATSSDQWMGFYLRISGADDTTPINAYNFVQSTSNQDPHVIPVITTTVDDCLVLYGLSFDGGDAYPFSVSGTGWSEIDEDQTSTSGNNAVSGCFGSKNLTSQGSSGIATVDCSTSDGAAYFQLAIAPSGGASGSAETDYLQAKDFGFDIPEGAIIEGITVKIDKYANVTNSVKDYSIQLRNSAGPKGNIEANVSYWGDSDSNYYTIYGGPNFLWGTSWTVAEIENSFFGVDIVAVTDTSALAAIDHVRILINYSLSLSGEPWQDPYNTTSQDNYNSKVSFNSTTEDTSDELRLTDFGFTIPSTATITGIEIRMDRDSSVPSTIKDAEIYLRKTIGQVGNNLSSGLWWDSVGDHNYDIYGGSSELWGASWDYADINSPNFGIELFVKYFGAVPVEARIDHLQIRIHYSEPPQSQEAWIDSSKAIDQNDEDAFVSFNTATEIGSNWLRLTDFDYFLPTGATVLGILVEIDRKSTLTDSIWDGSIFLRNSLGQVGEDKAMGGYWDPIDNDEYDSYGGPTDLWGTTWSVADINSADFGLDIFVNSSGLVTTEARIDYVRITIYYSTSSSEIEIIDNKFSIDIPSLPVGEELCSIEDVRVNGTSYDHSYFVDAVDGIILITLLSPVDLDGSYDSLSPISVDIGISNKTHNSDQFIASFDFSQLPQDNYTFVGEFYDITGVISQFTINYSISIDFDGPQIYSQFINNCSINPESGFISFVLNRVLYLLS